MKPAFTFLLLGAVAAAQSIEPPLAGLIRDARNEVRPVHGIAANFVLSAAPLGQARKVAFSGRFALLKTDDAVVVLDWRGAVERSLPAPGGDALFAFDLKGAPAWVWFPETRELRDLAGETSRVLDEALISLRTPEDYLVLRDRKLVRGGAPVSSDEFSEAPPALLMADGTVLFVAGSELVVIPTGGEERRITLDARVTALEQMSDEWVFLRGAGRVLRLRDCAVYRLPEVTR